MPRSSLVPLLLLLSLLGAPCGARPRSQGLPIAPAQEAYQALFRGSSRGWRGGDGVSSVPLSPQVTLWLFGDSFVGAPDDPGRPGSVMIHNSLALQVGRAPERSNLRFYWGPESGGKPSSFFPARKGRWHWPYGGYRHGQALHLFLMDVSLTRSGDPFGFRQVGTSLVRIEDPDRSPRAWRQEKVRVPHGLFRDDRQRFWGSAVLPRGRHVYIWGYDEDRTTFPTTKRWVLARAPRRAPERFQDWEFFNGSGWSAEEADLALGEFALPVEFSVHEDPQGGLQLVHSVGTGLDATVFRRTAPAPEGPWSPAKPLFVCPEPARIPQSWCYSAKAHPESRVGPGRLLVSYCSNSFDLDSLVRDDRLYYPHFRVVPRLP